VQKLSGDSTAQSPGGQISLIAQGGTLAGSVGLAAATLSRQTGILRQGLSQFLTQVRTNAA